MTQLNKPEPMNMSFDQCTDSRHPVNVKVKNRREVVATPQRRRKTPVENPAATAAKHMVVWMLL